ncbi:MAG: DUF4124 domain-containing protein [Gammaproteobacteria bacterium]|nr:DUF4124 domain-containing protein [Gammaproteobacteria bacterium]
MALCSRIMHRWRNLIAAGVLATSACPASTIYKWTDPAGVVHFSDHPAPGAQKIQLDVDVVPAVRTPSVPAAPHSASPVPYQHFTIDSPTREQSFFSEAVPVHLTMQPALRPSDEIRWTLNGEALGAYANQLGFSLPDLPRGAYDLVATAIDRESGDTLNSANVAFYMHRSSILNPHHHPH